MHSVRIGRVSIVGCGWLGKALGNALVLAGYSVMGTVRQTTAIAELSELGIHSLYYDLSERPPVELLSSDATFFLVPFRRNLTDISNYERLCVRYFYELSKHRPSRIIFASSTSVYSSDMGWKIEDSDSNNLDARATILRQTEAEIIRLFSTRAVIFRLGGLIGDDRQISPAESGKLGPINVIHRDAVCQAMMFTLTHTLTHSIYNLVGAYHPDRAILGSATTVSNGNQRSGTGKIVSGKRFRDETGLMFV